MNITRVVVLGVGGGALAAWLASASTSGTRPIEPAPQRKTAAIEKSGAELAAEIARLHDRLHPTTAPSDPSRNLFSFAVARASHAPTETQVPATPVATPDPAPVAPPMQLLGIAEDSGIRTAILSSGDQVLLVKEGERAGEAYTVAHIDATAVELTGVAVGSRSIRLALK